MTDLPGVRERLAERLHADVNYHADSFTKFLLTVCAALIGTGVIGLWGMNSQIAGLSGRFEAWQQIAEKRYNELSERDILLVKRVNENQQHADKNEQKVDDLIRRINSIEQLLRARP